MYFGSSVDFIGSPIIPTSRTNAIIEITPDVLLTKARPQHEQWSAIFGGSSACMEIKCPGHQGIVRKDAAANTNSSLIRKHVAMIDALAFPHQ